MSIFKTRKGEREEEEQEPESLRSSCVERLRKSKKYKTKHALHPTGDEESRDFSSRTNHPRVRGTQCPLRILPLLCGLSTRLLQWPTIGAFARSTDSSILPQLSRSILYPLCFLFFFIRALLSLLFFSYFKLLHFGMLYRE